MTANHIYRQLIRSLSMLRLQCRRCIQFAVNAVKCNHTRQERNHIKCGVMIENPSDIAMCTANTEHGVSVIDSPQCVRANAGSTMVHSVTAHQTHYQSSRTPLKITCIQRRMTWSTELCVMIQLQPSHIASQVANV